MFAAKHKAFQRVKKNLVHTTKQASKTMFSTTLSRSMATRSSPFLRRTVFKTAAAPTLPNFSGRFLAASGTNARCPAAAFSTSTAHSFPKPLSQGVPSWGTVLGALVAIGGAAAFVMSNKNKQPLDLHDPTSISIIEDLIQKEQNNPFIHPADIGYLRLGLGEALVLNGRIDEGLAEYDKALVIFNDFRSKAPDLVALDNYSSQYHFLIGSAKLCQGGKLEDALLEFNKAEKWLMNSAGKCDADSLQHATLAFHSVVGRELWEHNHFKEALASFRKAEEVLAARNITDELNVFVEFAIGCTLSHIGDSEGAIKHLELANEAYKSMSASEGESVAALTLIAFEKKKRGDAEGANEACRKAFTAVEEAREASSANVAMEQLIAGTFFVYINGESEESMTLFKSALKTISNEAPGSILEADCRFLIGIGLLTQEEYEDALIELHKALDVYSKDAPGSPYETYTIALIGVALQCLGRAEEAKNQYGVLSDIREQVGAIKQAGVLWQALSICLFHQKSILKTTPLISIEF